MIKRECGTDENNGTDRGLSYGCFLLFRYFRLFRILSRFLRIQNRRFEMKEHDRRRASMLGEYRRALVFVLPYWRRLAFVLAISLFSTVLGLVQPYIAKLLIDEALLRRNLRALAEVA